MNDGAPDSLWKDNQRPGRLARMRDVDRSLDPLRHTVGKGGVGVQHLPAGLAIVLRDDLRFGESGSGNVFPARIVSGSGQTYSADIYANGPDSAATSTGVVVKFPTLNVAETIPAGTWIMAVVLA